MKKQNLLTTVLLLCALVAGSTSVWAASGDKLIIDDWSTLFGVAADAGALTGDANKDYEGNIGGLTASYKKATNMYIKTADIRIYKSSQLIFSVPSGYKITKIEFGGNFSSGKLPTSDVGTLNTSTKIWTGEASSVKIYRTDNNTGYSKITSATFTLSAPATFGAGKTMISFSNATDVLDLTTANLPTGLAAYKVSEATTSTVTLTTVNSVVKKNTGVILTSTTDDKTYDIPVLGEGSDISGSNKLVASDGTSTVSDAAVLSNGEFHPLTAGVIAAGKAYLPYDNITGGNPFTGGAHALDIVFDNGDVTGIEQVANSQDSWLNGQFYDLQGRKVAQPTKGLYIVNGKKVIIK